jgi:hypothetical protein
LRPFLLTYWNKLWYLFGALPPLLFTPCFHTLGVMSIRFIFNSHLNFQIPHELADSSWNVYFVICLFLRGEGEIISV